MLNENKYDEMCQILINLQKRYCPTINVTESDIMTRFQILLDGDQLTVARARGAIRLRETHLPEERIDGFLPVITDWHARMTLVAVSDNCIHTVLVHNYCVIGLVPYIVECYTVCFVY